MIELSTTINSFQKKTKDIPYLKQIVASFSYLFQNNRKIISGKNNIIQIDTCSSLPDLKNVIFKINGDGNNIVIKGGVKLSDTKIEIQGHRNQILIDESCRIKGSYIWVEDENCKLKIGKETSFEKEVKICVTEPNSVITIGENCMLAYGAIVRCGDSHSIIDLSTGHRINYAKDIHIKDRVWIATNAQILKGVCIGSNSIVAAGSVVTKDVAENCIVAGVPAQVKKTNVAWDRKKIY